MISGMDSGKLHILYILRSFPTITEMSTLNEITGMIRRGIRISIVSLNKPADADCTHEDVSRYHLLDRTYYLNMSHGIKKWKNIILRTIYGQVKLFFRAKIPIQDKLKVSVYSMKKMSRRLSLVHLADLIDHINEKKPDVIYFHFALHAGELIILRKIFNIPFVVFFHGFDFSKRLRFDQYNYPEMFHHADWFFANSNFSADKIKGLGCPPEKLSVPGLPVDDANYPFKIRVKREKTRLLTIARLVEKKGLQYSIRAVAGCMKKDEGLEYDIIGEGPLKDELASLITGLGCSGRIRLLGNQGKDKVIEAMLGSDIFILASITAKDGETEGLGMVLLESQLTGMPVIATAHNGFLDAIRDGITGFLVPEKDIPALSEKLTWLTDHPETWAEMGAAGRIHVLDNYSERVYLDKIIKQINLLRQSLRPRRSDIANILLAESEKSQAENENPVSPYIFSALSREFAGPVHFTSTVEKKKGKVGIIVLNRNGEDHVEKLFKSFISYNTYPDYEIILVDHGSDNGSRKIIRHYKERLNIRLIPFDRNFTYSYSNNYAAGQTDAEYLFFLNNDIIFDQDVIGDLVSYMDQHPEAGIIAPVLYFPDENFNRSGRVQHSGIRFVYRQKKEDQFRPAGTFPPSFYITKYDSCHLFRDTIVPIISQEPGSGHALNPAICAAAMLCRKSDFIRAGGFNENYVYGYEDIDLSLIIYKESGKQLIVVHDLGMIHNESFTRRKERMYKAPLKIHNLLLLTHRFGYLVRFNYLKSLFGDGFWTDQKPVVKIISGTQIKRNDETDIKIKFLSVLLRDKLGWETSLIQDSESVSLGETDLTVNAGQFDPALNGGEKDSLIRVTWSDDGEWGFPFDMAYEEVFTQIGPETPDQDILRMMASVPGPDPFQQFIIRRIENHLSVAVKSPIAENQADRDDPALRPISSLENGLKKDNFPVRVDRPEEWYKHGILKDNVVISFTSDQLYYPQPGQINVLWITHELTDAYLPYMPFFDLFVTGRETDKVFNFDELGDTWGNPARKLCLSDESMDENIGAITDELLAIHRQKSSLPY